MVLSEDDMIDLLTDIHKSEAIIEMVEATSLIDDVEFKNFNKKVAYEFFKNILK